MSSIHPRPAREGTLRRASRHALLVANPAAQSGRNEARIAEARSLLDRAAISHDLLATLPGGRTAQAVSQALSKGAYGFVIAMGGDGTISEVARGLLGSGLAREVPLGLLPTGTANDIGKSFGLASSEAALERNVDVLVAGPEIDFDVGRLCAADEAGQTLREELFVDSVGWGFGPYILRRRNQERQRVEAIPVVREIFRDHLLYLAAAVRALGESYVEDMKFDVDLVADGTRHTWRGLNDLVIKGPRVYAGLWVLDAKSRPDDGLFELVPFVGRRDWLAKALVYLDHTGSLEEGLQELGLDFAGGLRAAKVELRLKPRNGTAAIPAQVDGEELCSSSRAQIEVLPRALRLVVARAP